MQSSELSNSQKTPEAADSRTALLCLWAARIILGATFIISGWSKAIDPWGFLIKVNEYLAAWGWELPRELVLSPCVALSAVEFCTGILVATGCFRRVAVWMAGLMLLFMTPLTLYIAVADPVSDCGCFGDLFVISNWATFAKNLVLVALVVVLIVRGGKMKLLFPAPVQWLVVVASLAFPLSLSLVGYHVQPLVDFRPYRTGTVLFEGSDLNDNVSYIYEKDGEQREFDLSALPDSTWSFVEAKGLSVNSDPEGFEVRDLDGYPVNSDLQSAGVPMLLIIVPEPGVDYLSEAHYANRLAEYAAAKGVDTYGIVASAGEALVRWTDLVQPVFDIFSAEDTSLQQLVRGDVGVVYIDGDGRVLWKRTLKSLPRDLYGDGETFNSLDSVEPVDNGNMHLIFASVYLAAMLLIYILGQSPKILRIFVRHTEKND